MVLKCKSKFQMKEPATLLTKTWVNVTKLSNLSRNEMPTCQAVSPSVRRSVHHYE